MMMEKVMGMCVNRGERTTTMMTSVNVRVVVVVVVVRVVRELCQVDADDNDDLVVGVSERDGS